jgi:hypothetical protein
MIDHRKTSSYHPEENGVVESFNKTLHKGLTKICGSTEMIRMIRCQQYYGHTDYISNIN